MKLNDYPLWTALVTPFTPGGSIDYTSLKKLLNEQTSAKNALLILGSTGEALNIDTETKKNIIDFVLEQKPKVPVMVGISGHNLKETKKWMSWLETKDVDAYLCVTPLYAKPGDEGQYLWFKELMDLSTKPVMLYNVPGRTGKELSLKAVQKLSSHKNFWAIKEASGDVKKFKEYLCASNNGKVFCGDDGLFFDFAQAGSCGLVSVASNVWPKQTNLYVEKSLNNTLKAKFLWSNAADSLFIASNPIPAKALLFSQKRIEHKTMMAPLHEDDLQDLNKILLADNKVNNWFKEQK